MNQPLIMSFIDLLPQPVDMPINDIALGLEIVIPGGFEQHRTGDEPSGMSHEDLEEKAFSVLQGNHPSTPRGTPAGQFKAQVADNEDGLAARAIGPSREGLDPGQKLRESIGLGQIVVAAGLHPLDPIEGAGNGAQHQHGCKIWCGAQTPHQIDSIKTRQPPIDDEHIVDALQCEGKADLPFCRAIDNMTAFLQSANQIGGAAIIVLDHKKAHVPTLTAIHEMDFMSTRRSTFGPDGTIVASITLGLRPYQRECLGNRMEHSQAARRKSMARILVVEDDPQTATEVVAALTDHGYVATAAGTGREGLLRAATEDFDAIVLDRMLPEGMDGLAVLATLRATGNDVPVLVLSALSAVDERVRGLKAGGDDYLTKPFEYLELTARLDVLLRRRHGPQRETTLRVADLEIDLLTHTVQRSGQIVELLPREFRLLEYLMRHAGQVVTRTMLFEEVWHYRYDEPTNVIDVHVGKLRRKLERPGSAPLIHTVRGAGYILHAPR